MATEIEPTTETPVSAIQRAWKPYRLNVKQFLAMIDAGIFPEDAHVELLEGVMIDMMTKGDPHDNTLDALSETLRRLIPAGWLHREDKSLQLDPRTRLEPDIAIVRGPRLPFTKRCPRANETALVIEVASSSYSYDRGEKWRAYAAARIPIYWIVNINKSQVEVYRNPIGRGKTARYRQTDLFTIDAEVAVVIDGQDVGRIVVKEILP